MIKGHKPNGYYVTATGEGHKIEGESRQCVHCQFIWEYHPGSGDRRGYCLKCDGFLCGRQQCFVEQRRMIDLFQQETGKVRTCIPFEEWNSRVRERVEHYLGGDCTKVALDPALTITPSGLVVPR